MECPIFTLCGLVGMGLLGREWRRIRTLSKAVVRYLPMITHSLHKADIVLTVFTSRNAHEYGAYPPVDGNEGTRLDVVRIY